MSTPAALGRALRRAALSLTSVVVLPAQQPTLVVGAVPGRLDARLDAVPPSHVAGLLIGHAPGSTPLPCGVVGIEAPELVALAPPGPFGAACFSASFPTNALRGATLWTQGFTWDSTWSPEDPRAFALSPPVTARVPQQRDVAPIYVLFGQSNAEGFAASSALPNALRGALPRCRIWNAAAAAFEAIEDGVNTRTITPPTWCGPELGLAASLTADGRVVYLVKVAVGATSLGPAPGRFNEWGAAAGELYSVLLRRVADAAMALRALDHEPRVRGICMMQGESDATSAALADGYARRLDELVRRLRADLVGLGLGEAEPIPFAIGRIDSRLPSHAFSHVSAVRAAQTASADRHPRCVCVETNLLSLQGDGVHFDTAGVTALGRAFAEALRRLERER